MIAAVGMDRAGFAVSERLRELFAAVVSISGTPATASTLPSTFPATFIASL
jgi:hypothetical protein